MEFWTAMICHNQCRWRPGNGVGQTQPRRQSQQTLSNGRGSEIQETEEVSEKNKEEPEELIELEDESI
jgi:hypothetical protein